MRGAPVVTAVAMAVLFVALGSATADAQQQRRTRIELTPFIGVGLDSELKDADTGEPVRIDEAAVYGLSLGLRMDQQRWLEVFASFQQTSVSEGSLFESPEQIDLEIATLQAGGSYLFLHGPVQPFVVGTLGMTRFSPKMDGLSATTRFSGSLGGGVKLFVFRNVGLRIEGRGKGVLLTSDTGVLCSGGCFARTDSKVLVQMEALASVTVAL